MVRLMTWISLRFGRRAGRCVLPLIVVYFLLLAAPARRASRIYLRRALGREPGWRDLYRHLHFFASTIHDRIYLINDRFDLFDIEVVGGELVTDLLATGRGAFLMGAHLGSFEVLRARRARRGLDVAMVMYEENARKVNAALAAVNPAARLDIIPLGRVESMLQVRQRLHDGAIVGILGDRTLGGDDTISVSFLGAPAALPTGPFRIGRDAAAAGDLHGRRLSRRQSLPDPLRSARGLFRDASAERRDAALREAVERFAAVLERHCRAAPYNWFNFFDFWQPPPATGTAAKGASVKARSSVARDSFRCRSSR